MIRVLIVDDQALIREGLSLMLDLYDEIEIVGEASNGKEAIDFVVKEEVDVILMDIRMPIMDGVEATKVIKDRYPDTKIIILTTFNEDEYIFKGLKNGADSYILKDVSSKELVNIIKTVHSGEMLFHRIYISNLCLLIWHICSGSRVFVFSLYSIYDNNETCCWIVYR